MDWSYLPIRLFGMTLEFLNSRTPKPQLPNIQNPSLSASLSSITFYTEGIASWLCQMLRRLTTQCSEMVLDHVPQVEAEQRMAGHFVKTAKSEASQKRERYLSPRRLSLRKPSLFQSSFQCVTWICVATLKLTPVTSIYICPTWYI